ncbi:MAG: 1-acyl-sn-glycerol-3-phosphate acyltransferase [Chlorobi bacterium]|nr:1-acyl-sn-glycerol-3-phosphate acyltransferase [Chlorobiota bacterium]
MIKFFSGIKLFFLILITVAATVFVSIVYLVYIAFRGDPGLFNRIGRKWSKFLLKLFGIRCSINGLEKLDPDKTYVYVCNHSSLFDIPVVMASLKENVRIMYKKELEKIPIFGYGLRKSNFIAVTRSNPRNAMASIEEAVKTVQENASVLVFPEGTRSVDGKLGSFKRGAFILASRSEKEIVPVAIQGTSAILPSKSFKAQSGDVVVNIGHPMSFDSSDDRAAENRFMNEVRDEISKMLDS